MTLEARSAHEQRPKSKEASEAVSLSLRADTGSDRDVRFAGFSLDLGTGELHRDGVWVPIRPTPLRVLVCLARRIGHIVPKQELLDEVWPDSVVTDASLSTALRELRQVLGDDGRRQALIQTFRSQGVRLVPPEPGGSAGSAAMPSRGSDPVVAVAIDEKGEGHHHLLTRLGAALFEEGRADEARDAFHAAARAARAEGDISGFVAAALGSACELGTIGVAVPSPTQAMWLEEALAYESAAPPSMRARLRARLAAMLPSSRRDEAVRLATEALRLARRAADPSASIGVLHDAYWVLWSPGNTRMRRMLAREMIEAAEAAGDGLAAGLAHQLESAALLELGDRAGAEAASERADRGMRTRALPATPAWRAGWHACMALLDGRFREAEFHLEEALRVGRAIGLANAPRIYALQLVWLRFDQGRLGELAALADGVDRQLPIGRAARALVLDAAGRRREAQQELSLLATELAAMPRDAFWLGTLTFLAELAVELGERVAAANLYTALRPHESQCVLIGSRTVCRGSVALYLGLLAGVAGNRDAVIPHLESRGRCIAPDLIGMGDSAKLPPASDDGRDGRYRFVEHRRYLDALLDELGVRDDVTLVLHDWGSALGFDWARRHPERVRAIAYMEAIVRPMRMDDLDLVPRLMFRAMRGPLGELLVIRMNLFIEQILPMSVQRELSVAEMDAYRAPYRAGGEDRRPLLTWPREIPFDGEPADTHEILSAYSSWLPTTSFPKLLIAAQPGAILTGEALAHARSFANQTELEVEGIHFVQEDAPDEIGRGIAAWMDAQVATAPAEAPAAGAATE